MHSEPEFRILGAAPPSMDTIPGACFGHVHGWPSVFFAALRRRMYSFLNNKVLHIELEGKIIKTVDYDGVRVIVAVGSVDPFPFALMQPDQTNEVHEVSGTQRGKRRRRASR